MDSLPTPRHARNMRLIGYSDQGGRPDGVQVMAGKGHVYVGHHIAGGFSVLDVSDPRNPRTVNFVAAPPNTSSLFLQLHDDLLLVAHIRDSFAQGAPDGDRNWSAGMAVYDVSKPAEPRQIGFFPVEGVGLHRMWYVGGRWAYVSALLDGFSNNIMVIVDLADPTRPVEAGRFWLPGMNSAAGEMPHWPLPSGYYSLHHPIVHGDIAWCSWRDAGLVVVDIADRNQPKLIAHRNLRPPFGGGTHNAVPLPDRNLLVVVDEAHNDDPQTGDTPDCLNWVFDIREPSNPVSISTFPSPSDANYAGLGGRFGPHNIHENRPGSFVSSELIFGTYQTAGLRAYDIRDAFRPVEVGALVPPALQTIPNDPRPFKGGVLQSNDIFVESNGIIYMTDFTAGLHVIEYLG